MYKFFILSLTLLLLINCTSNTIYKKPDDLIPKKQMVDLLTDMYLANAAYNVSNKNLERKIDYMPLVYEKYGIDSIRFQHSNVYYFSRLDDYKDIHIKVKERLKKILDTTRAAQKIKDSLKLIKSQKKILIKDIKIPKNLSEKKPKFLKNQGK